MSQIVTQNPAIDKATRIFDFIAQQGGSTYSQIYQGLALPQSSTSALLASLVANGLLRQNDGKYFLGLIFYELGHKAVEQFNIRELALEPLTVLRNKTGLVCHLGILDQQAAIYLAKVDSPNAITIKSWLGKRLSLHSSALGKVLLAWLPESKVDELLPEQTFTAHTANTICDKDQFKQGLNIVKQRGWAFDNGEDYEGITCIAAPVFDRNGRVVAAISTSGVAFQMPAHNIEQIALDVIAAANMLAEKIR